MKGAKKYKGEIREKSSLLERKKTIGKNIVADGLQVECSS